MHATVSVGLRGRSLPFRDRQQPFCSEYVKANPLPLATDILLRAHIFDFRVT